MVKCQNCGVEVSGSNFCFNCGEKIENYENSSDICPRCGTKNSKNTAFCNECGYKLDNIQLTSKSKTDWETKRAVIIEKYDKLAEEIGIKDEDYFLTSIVRYNHLEQKTAKHKKWSLVSGVGNKTTIDGFFLIKEDKFVFMEIDNRDWKKANVGINNLYFDKIVSMRVTKRLGDNSRYEDITKRTPINSANAILKYIRNDIQSLKATRFKDMIATNDSGDMFDRLLFKLVDNTSFEIRLPSFEFGQNLVDLFETLRVKSRDVIIENQTEPSKAQQIKEYQELLYSGAITQEEFDKIKQELLFN